VFPDKKLSFGSGAEATAAAYRFWDITASVRRFEESADFEEELKDSKGVLEVVESERPEQPAVKSWPLVRRNDVRSIAPANAHKEVQE